MTVRAEAAVEDAIAIVPDDAVGAGSGIRKKTTSFVTGGIAGTSAVGVIVVYWIRARPVDVTARTLVIGSTAPVETLHQTLAISKGRIEDEAAPGAGITGGHGHRCVAGDMVSALARVFTAADGAICVIRCFCT